MFQGFMLIAVVAVISGIIAYIGDKLGYKLGKQRLSIFGLRPKHTSTLMAILSGMIIAALTLTALSIASKDVRTALFGMQQLKKELSSMSDEIKTKSEELKVKSEELDGLRKQLLLSSDDVAKANIERDKANEHLVQVEMASEKAYFDLARYQAESERLGRLRESLQKEVAQLEYTTEKLEEGILSLREGQIMFRANQVIYDGVIKAGQGEQKTTEDLQEFLAYANKFVVESLELENKNSQIVFVTQENFVKTVRSIMQQPNGSVAIRVQTLGNIMVGEPILTEFVVYQNNLIYLSNQEIYKERVLNDDNKNPEEILVSFLSRLNNKVVADGLLPDPLSGNVGTLDIPYMMEITEKIRNTQGAFTISAVTSKEIYTLGPLQITIQIKPIL